MTKPADRAMSLPALVGQESGIRVLRMRAIDPRLGGVLRRSEEATAESTIARGLARVLAPIESDRGWSPAPAEALAAARSYLGRSKVEMRVTDEYAVQLAFDRMVTHRLGRKRLADALFAASLRRHGVDTLETCNTADFLVFEGLRAVDPARPE